MCKAMEDMRMQAVMDDRKRYSMQTFEKGRMYLEEIVRILKGVPCRVNLIRFHAIPGVELEGVGMDTMLAFRDYLTKHGVFATVRASRGEDVFAACGMLSTLRQEE